MVPAMLRRRFVRSGAAAMVAGLAFAGAPAAHNDARPLPGAPGPRPGPEILYRPLASSPQLANVAPWKAEPILVSGASAYRKGEFLYQDYLYDDYGADGGGDSDLSRRGTYRYPTDPKYASNAADFVELRLQPLATATAVRITYNTMHDPALVATTIALGSSATAYEMPHGANARAPAKVFVTVHGTTADIGDAATGLPLTGVAPSVSVSLERRQVDVRIPYAAFDPRGKVVRVAAATGLWDVAHNRYLVPNSGAPTATHPGGAGTLTRPPAFFNVAFRYTEPVNSGPSSLVTGFSDWSRVVTGFSAWGEYQQATALATGDLSPFFANVDFTKLAKQINDDMRGQPHGVPETGPMSRIMVSHFESAQGRGDATNLFPENCDGNVTEPPCIPNLAGRLQPYGIYVPTQPPSPSGYGLTIGLSGGDGLSWKWSHAQSVIELGERGRGSIVITPSSRGGLLFYGQGAAAIFEAWADVATRYHINPDNVIVHGVSHGGYGAYKFAAQFPDLFVAATPIVPCPNRTSNGMILPLVPSYRHVPIFSWSGTADELCWYHDEREVEDKLTALGYRHEAVAGAGDHVTAAQAASDDYSMIIEWLENLESRQMVRDPAHVTYVFSQYMNEPYVGVNADHAYWISDLQLRDDSGVPPIGTVDVFSHGFGIGDAPALPTIISEGVLMTTPPFVYVRESHELGPAPSIPVQNRLDITVRNIRAFTIDPTRARVDCNAALNVDTEGHVDITLRGCNRAVAYGGAS